MRGGLSPIEARRLVGKPDTIETELDLHRRQRRVGWSILAFVAVALTVGMCAASSAAERERYEIWAVRSSGKALRGDQPNWIKVSAPAYPTKTDCDIAIRNTSIDRFLQGAGGWRLTCRQIDR